MGKADDSIRTLSFLTKHEFILLPPRMLAVLLVRGQKEPVTRIVWEDFFSSEFLDYLGRMLETNRHLPIFSYPQWEKEPFTKEKLYAIMEFQLRGMVIDGKLCFSRVSGENEESALIEYSAYGLCICRKGGLFCYQSESSGKSQTLFRLAPAEPFF